VTRIDKIDWVLYLKGWSIRTILAWKVKDELWTYPAEGAVYTIRRHARQSRTMVDPRDRAPYYAAPTEEQLDQI